MSRRRPKELLQKAKNFLHFGLTDPRLRVSLPTCDALTPDTCGTAMAPERYEGPVQTRKRHPGRTRSQTASSHNYRHPENTHLLRIVGTRQEPRPGPEVCPSPVHGSVRPSSSPGCVLAPPSRCTSKMLLGGFAGRHNQKAAYGPDCTAPSPTRPLPRSDNDARLAHGSRPYPSHFRGSGQACYDHRHCPARQHHENSRMPQRGPAQLPRLRATSGPAALALPRRRMPPRIAPRRHPGGEPIPDPPCPSLSSRLRARCRRRCASLSQLTPFADQVMI